MPLQFNGTIVLRTQNSPSWFLIRKSAVSRKDRIKSFLQSFPSSCRGPDQGPCISGASAPLLILFLQRWCVWVRLTFYHWSYTPSSCFCKTKSSCHVGWPWTHQSSALADRVLGLQVCVTNPGFNYLYLYYILIYLYVCRLSESECRSSLSAVTMWVLARTQVVRCVAGTFTLWAIPSIWDFIVLIRYGTRI